jgi:hypothetical protein
LNTYKKIKALIDKELHEIEVDYPCLHYRETDGKIVLEGEIRFNLKCMSVGEQIQDAYLIQICIPEDYPDNPPIAKEIGGKIADNFHKSKDSILCLDVPMRVHMIFRENPSLKHFIRELLEPYLYCHSYWKKHNGEMPFGYWAHYGEGILDAYSEYFGVENREAIIDFLKLLSARNYKQNILCPCGKGLKIKKCHGKKFLQIYNMVPDKVFSDELEQARTWLYGMKYKSHYFT